ncbi:hypothetical protein LOK49_LG08G00580 [Camellia lanceoleosa]|uniref:Uncharacterized protein n=1 Tax=Camellia lanceoleosa TaxID=1840588 RepID=A0ACC0GXV8_9ERIC|nr:hypothetical protein LOK49_LG08G00580 [Camellia lanceoleosa]
MMINRSTKEIGEDLEEGRQRRDHPLAMVFKEEHYFVYQLSVRSSLSKQRKLQEEAQATIQVGKALGVEMRGKEGESIEKKIQMENDDAERPSAKGDKGGA